MEIEIQVRSRVPITEQIAHRVMELIESGKMQPGDQLPTTRELAVKLGINFNTVARAYRILDKTGIISTQPGRGTFILDPHQDGEGKSTRDEDIKELARHYILQASHLGYEPEQIRDCVERLVEEDRESTPSEDR
jgi:GntR family transcriptional regulator